MHVIGHQSIGMQGDVLFRQCIAQVLAIVGKVLVVQEGSGAIDAAMGDMQRDSGQFQSWTAGHGQGYAWRERPD